MKFEINNEAYQVIIIKKSNKNTYIRINDENQIIITTNYLMPKYKIKNLLEQNKDSILKMIKCREKKKEKEQNFYYLGKIYDIIIDNKFKDTILDEEKIYTNSYRQLDKWLKSKTEEIFLYRLDTIYKNIKEEIPYPKLKIRNMKSRWGVCNKKGYITLNSNLIKYNISAIDYVIVHELCHYIHFNHSKQFWQVVSKYCSNYKEIKKILKE